MSPRSELNYNLLTPRKIVFGWGRRYEAGDLARTLGTRAFLVTGSRTLFQSGIIAEIEKSLEQSGVEPVPLAVISHEPEVADVDNTVTLLAERNVGPGDVLLAIGGGSAIDLAKASAALITNREGETVSDYLEGVGRGLSIVNAPLPLMVLPTTAGTGSEATKNAVISSYAPAFKKSLRSEQMVPDIVLIDPELAVSLPATVTAHTGMDALTQLIESYISRRAQPVPRALCRQGIEFAIPALVESVENGASREAREAMAHAALLSGMALANSGLGMAHGVAAALGVHARVPHGLACAVMLPVALRVNRAYCAVELGQLSELITGRCWSSTEKAVDASIRTIEEMGERIGIPRRLCDLGVQADQLPAIVTSSRGNSMSGNPRELSDTELSQILEEIL